MCLLTVMVLWLRARELEVLKVPLNLIPEHDGRMVCCLVNRCEIIVLAVESVIIEILNYLEVFLIFKCILFRYYDINPNPTGFLNGRYLLGGPIWAPRMKGSLKLSKHLKMPKT